MQNLYVQALLAKYQNHTGMHCLSNRGHKCDFHKQISEEVLDNAVAEVITQLVRKPKFAALMQSKIDMKVDTAGIDQEIENLE